MSNKPAQFSSQNPCVLFACCLGLTQTRCSGFPVPASLSLSSPVLAYSERSKQAVLTHGCLRCAWCKSQTFKNSHPSVKIVSSDQGHIREQTDLQDGKIGCLLKSLYSNGQMIFLTPIMGREIEKIMRSRVFSKLFSGVEGISGELGSRQPHL